MVPVRRTGRATGASLSNAHFAHWLTGERRGLSAIGGDVVTRFRSEHLLACGCTYPVRRLRHELRTALAKLSEVLRADGVGVLDPTLDIVVAQELARFETHMRDVWYLADNTRRWCDRVVGEFLLAHFGSGRRLGGLPADRLTLGAGRSTVPQDRCVAEVRKAANRHGSSSIRPGRADRPRRMVVASTEDDQDHRALFAGQRSRHPVPPAGAAHFSGRRHRHRGREPAGRRHGHGHRYGRARRARLRHAAAGGAAFVVNDALQLPSHLRCPPSSRSASSRQRP